MLGNDVVTSQAPQHGYAQRVAIWLFASLSAIIIE